MIVEAMRARIALKVERLLSFLSRNAFLFLKNLHLCGKIPIEGGLLMSLWFGRIWTCVCTLRTSGLQLGYAVAYSDEATRDTSTNLSYTHLQYTDLSALVSDILLVELAIHLEVLLKRFCHYGWTRKSASGKLQKCDVVVKFCLSERKKKIHFGSWHFSSRASLIFFSFFSLSSDSLILL